MERLHAPLGIRVEGVVDVGRLGEFGQREPLGGRDDLFGVGGDGLERYAEVVGDGDGADEVQHVVAAEKFGLDTHFATVGGDGGEADERGLRDLFGAPVVFVEAVVEVRLF